MFILDIYRLDVESGELLKIDEITTYKGLQFYKVMNGNGGCQFSLNIYDKKANKSNLRRYRNQIAIRNNNRIEWWGPLTKVAGDMEGLNGQLLIDGSEYLYHFTDRQTDELVSYNNTEQQDIAWDLIDTTQNKTNGTLLVERGSYNTSIARDNDYENASVRDSLIGLTNVVDGFDFTFDPVLDADNLITHTNFNCYYPMLGSNRDDLPTLELGVNVHRIEFVTNTDLINTGRILGQGTGSPLTIPIEYPASQKGYTRRERVISAKDVGNPSELSLRLGAFLNNDMVEGFAINAELMPKKKPYYTDINLGDIVNIDFHVDNSGGYVDIKKQARIIEIAVNIDINGVERVVPKLQVLG